MSSTRATLIGRAAEAHREVVRPEEGHQADVAVPPEEVLHPEARLQALRRRQIAATANNRKSGFNSGCAKPPAYR